MANSDLGNSAGTTHRLGVMRLAATLGVGAGLIFGLCWLGLFIPLSSPTHTYIGMFTTAAPNSGAALLEGTAWSVLFGGLTGTVLAVLYNLFGRLDRR